MLNKSKKSTLADENTNISLKVPTKPVVTAPSTAAISTAKAKNKDDDDDIKTESHL